MEYGQHYLYLFTLLHHFRHKTFMSSHFSGKSPFHVYFHLFKYRKVQNTTKSVLEFSLPLGLFRPKFIDLLAFKVTVQILPLNNL